LLNQAFNDANRQTIHAVLELPGPARVAAAAPISIACDLEENEINRFDTFFDVAEMAISIFPNSGQNWLVISYHRRFRDRLGGFVAQLRALSPTSLAVAASQIIIMYVENVVFCPTYVSSLPAADRAAVERSFSETIHEKTTFALFPKFDFFTNPDRALVV